MDFILLCEKLTCIILYGNRFILILCCQVLDQLVCCLGIILPEECFHFLALTFYSGCFCHLDHVKRIWYLSPMRAAKVQASLRIRAVSPEPSLLAHTSSESRGTFRQKARSLAPLNGWACAVKICHDGMLEDTNSFDGAHFISVLIFVLIFSWLKLIPLNGVTQGFLFRRCLPRNSVTLIELVTFLLKRQWRSNQHPYLAVWHVVQNYHLLLLEKH